MRAGWRERRLLNWTLFPNRWITKEGYAVFESIFCDSSVAIELTCMMSISLCLLKKQRTILRWNSSAKHNNFKCHVDKLAGVKFSVWKSIVQRHKFICSGNTWHLSPLVFKLLTVNLNCFIFIGELKLTKPLTNMGSLPDPQQARSQAYASTQVLPHRFAKKKRRTKRERKRQ